MERYDNRIDEINLKLEALRSQSDEYSIQLEIVMLLCELSNILYRSDPEKAEVYGNQALELSEKIGFKKGKAESQIVIGTSYWVRGNYYKALFYYTRSLKICEEMEYRKGIASCYSNIANILKDQGDYEQALINHIRALKIKEEIIDKPGTAKSYNNIGIIYDELMKHDHALENYNKALHLFKELGDTQGIALTYNNIGVIFETRGDITKAFEYYHLSLDIKEEIGDKKGISASYMNIGSLYNEQKDYNRALEYFLKALTIYKEIGDNRSIADSNNNIGCIYIQLKHYDSAKIYLQNGLDLARKIGIKNLETDSYKYFSELYQAQNNFEQALIYHRKYNKLREKIFSEVNAEKIAKIQVKYETEKMEKEKEIYKNIYENTLIGMFRITPEGDILMANSALVKMLGYSSFDELVFHNPHTRGNKKFDISEYINGKEVVLGLELAWLRKDGSSLFVRISSRTVCDELGDIQYYEGTIEDISGYKHAEKMLQKSKEKYLSLVETMEEGIGFVDENEIFVYINQAASNIFGYTKDEMIGKNLKEFTTHEMFRRVLKETSLRKEGKSSQYELSILKKNGEERIITLKASPEVNEDGIYEGSFGIFQDITEHKKAEEELAYRIELEHIVQNLSMDFIKCGTVNYNKVINHGLAVIGEFLEVDRSYIFQFDLIQKTLSNIYEWCSKEIEPQIENLHSIPLSTIPYGMEQLETFKDINIPSVAELPERLKKEREFLEAQNIKSLVIVPIILKDDDLFGFIGFDSVRSKRFWKQEEIEFLRLIGNLIGNIFCRKKGEEALRELNVTLESNVAERTSKLQSVNEHLQNEIAERNRAEEQIRKSEESYRYLIEHQSDGLAIVDPDEFFVFANPAAHNIFGVKQGDLPGCNIMEFIDEENLQIILSQTKMHKSGQETEYEVKIIRQDGSSCIILISGQPQYDNKGQFTGTFGVFRDVTEHKRIEEEKKKLQDQLNQNQKMESIGRLAGGIAHNFNNLLNVIMGYSELMQSDETLSEEQKENLQFIRDAGQSSQVLTQQLLMFSRKQVARPHPIHLNKQIENSLKMYRRLLGENINIVFKPGLDLPMIMADYHQIDQILVNLLINACDAIHSHVEDKKSSVIMIETSLINIDKQMSLSYNIEPGFYLCLSVRDRGIGMDKTTQEKIFEPFFTTKSEGEGTGLGLSTVFGIVGQNKGTIQVYSKPGKGSTFKIYWPSMKSKTNLSEQIKEKKIPLGGNDNLLLVEDEVNVKKLAVKVLTGLGYNVTSADSGEQALKLLSVGNLRPDLLITDVILPGINGKQLAEKIHKTLPDLAVLYTSGYTDDVIVQKGILKEGIELIEKPYSIITLTEKIREIIDRK